MTLSQLRRMSENFDTTQDGIDHGLRLDFAEIIWFALNRPGWSRERLAKDADWSMWFVDQVICAHANLSLSTIAKAAHVLGLSITLRLCHDAP